MKKIQLMLMALCLMSAFSLTSCKSDSREISEAESAAAGQRGETTKTQFLVSLSGNAVATDGVRRMDGAQVQKNGTRAEFRGMDNIVVIPFQNAPIAKTDSRLGAPLTLTLDENNTATNNSLPAAETTLTENNNSYIFHDVQIPLGTKSLLFYGKAIDKTVNQAITSDADLHTYGQLVMAGRDAETPEEIGFSFKKISEVNTDADKKAVGTTLATYLTSIANATGWAAATNEGEKNLRDTLLMATAGSSASVQAMVQHLYTTLLTYDDAVATAIKTAILSSGVAYESEDNKGTLVFPATMNGYPANIGLPEGAVSIAWKDDKFEVATTSVYNVTYDETTGTLTNNYVYPASLYYHAESTIKTANELKEDLYTASATQWYDIWKEYDGPDYVNSSTRSVAIKDSINYAVARLDVTVKQNATGKAKDYNQTEIESAFPISAVLVGGQKNVDYQFLPTGTDLFTVYDNAVPENWTVGEASKTNYTLLTQSEANESVKIAIEMTNNSGKNFFGVQGRMIPNGTKFYLIAELKVDKGTAPAGKTIDAIFLKDHNTIVNLTISSLAKAYNVVPDLTTESLELGFSVDLSWEQGLTFDIEL